MALQPLFAHIAQPHLIHDDLIVATETEAEHHLKRPSKSYPSIRRRHIPQSKQVHFRNLRDRILGSSYWLFRSTTRSSESASTIPHHTPRSKEELVSFLCMMQSNADFIPIFSRHAANFKELTKKTQSIHTGKGAPCRIRSTD